MPFAKKRRIVLEIPKFNLKNIKNIKWEKYQPYYTPLAVLAAGLMIAVAVYASGASKGANGVGGSPTANNGSQTGGQQGGKVNVSTGNYPLLGNQNAKVTLIEFGDFRCPFCESFFSNAEQNIMTDYVKTGKVKFAFRDYAFLGPASTVAANAAECANEQGKFWVFHDYLYKNQPPETDTSMYTVDKLTSIAEGLGLNSSQFKSCLSANKYQSKVDSDLSDGKQAGVQGTPSFFINGTLLVGAQPYDAFKSAIEAALNK